MENENLRKCGACGKGFTVKIFDAGYPGGKEREVIDCPWCGAENGSAITNGTVITRKVEEGG